MGSHRTGSVRVSTTPYTVYYTTIQIVIYEITPFLMRNGDLLIFLNVVTHNNDTPEKLYPDFIRNNNLSGKGILQQAHVL